MTTTSNRPPWWPTTDQKVHADAGCAHPDVCHVDAPAEVDAMARLLSNLAGIESWTCPRCESENYHTDPAEGCTSCPWVQDEN